MQFSYKYYRPSGTDYLIFLLVVLWWIYDDLCTDVHHHLGILQPSHPSTKSLTFQSLKLHTKPEKTLLPLFSPFYTSESPDSHLQSCWHRHQKIYSDFIYERSCQDVSDSMESFGIITSQPFYWSSPEVSSGFTLVLNHHLSSSLSWLGLRLTWSLSSCSHFKLHVWGQWADNMTDPHHSSLCFFSFFCLLSVFEEDSLFRYPFLDEDSSSSNQNSWILDEWITTDTIDISLMTHMAGNLGVILQ